MIKTKKANIRLHKKPAKSLTITSGPPWIGPMAPEDFDDHFPYIYIHIKDGLPYALSTLDEFGKGGSVEVSGDGIWVLWYAYVLLTVLLDTGGKNAIRPNVPAWMVGMIRNVRVKTTKFFNSMFALGAIPKLKPDGGWNDVPSLFANMAIGKKVIFYKQVKGKRLHIGHGEAPFPYVSSTKDHHDILLTAKQREEIEQILKNIERFFTQR